MDKFFFKSITTKVRIQLHMITAGMFLLFVLSGLLFVVRKWYFYVIRPVFYLVGYYRQ